MSMYSNWLQPARQNLLQCVVRFFHPRSSCPTQISADICGGRKSLVKPVIRQNISSSSVLSPKIVMHDDAYISRRSENNIKCLVHDDIGWKNRTTWYILPRHWLYEWFSQFHRCETYSVLSQSPSIISLIQLLIIIICYYSNNNNRISIAPCILLWKTWGSGLTWNNLQKKKPVKLKPKVVLVMTVVVAAATVIM